MLESRRPYSSLRKLAWGPTHPSLLRWAQGLLRAGPLWTSSPLCCCCRGDQSIEETWIYRRFILLFHSFVPL